MFIEVERTDGRKCRLKVDTIVNVLEETHKRTDGLEIQIIMIEAGTLKIKCINETLVSLFAKMSAAVGRNVGCVGVDGIDAKHRAPRLEEPVNITELKSAKRSVK